MSDIYSMSEADRKKSMGISIVDDVGDGSIDRAIKILAGFPHAADKAIGSAIRRAATSGEAYAAKAVQKEYFIKAADFKDYTKSKRHIITQGGSTTVDIEFRGYHIPLIKFDTKIAKDGSVSTRVKRSSARTTLDNVFAQTVGEHGHIGVFERLSDERLPIQEKLGPSTIQMMASNEDVEQDMGDRVRDVFEQRIEHEITAILNGWRKK